MNKYLTFVVLCIFATANASHYGGHHGSSANSANLGYVQLVSVPQNLNYGAVPLIEPSLVIPNIIPPSHGYGAQKIAAPGYASHSLAPAAPAGYAAHHAAPAVAHIAHHGGAYGSQHVVKNIHRAPALAQAISHTAGVRPASASSSSRSDKIHHAPAIHGVHGAHYGGHHGAHHGAY